MARRPATSDSPRVLALIPARGGSKGIPRKNVVTLGGRPLLTHSLEQAQIPQIDHVVVSTDDDDIAQVAADWGAVVVRRPEELAGDAASSESALLHALDTLRDERGWEPEVVVFLQATSPLRHPDDVAGALDAFHEAGADSLFSACRLEGFVWRKRDGELESLTYDHRQRPRRQDLEGEDLLENGSIYIFKPWVLRQLGNRLGGQIAVYRMDALHSFQIDEPRDLERLERLLAAEVRPAMDAPRPELDQVRLLVLDFDGVLTDDRVSVDQDGREAVLCSRGDGLGLERLRRHGEVEAVVLSKETNPVVAQRCRKLQLPCFQGYDRKLPQLRALAAERGLEAAQVAYVGNDVNDLEPMAWCGVAIAVADARPEVLRVADWVTRKPGGRGAVREVCDLLLDRPSS